ncbi:Nop10 family protein [Spraguea lophii 42_110]|uniref:H/ACA ribonucleoprotein complex subunit NOP10 n=1 Tax=Spraguea lophii (strain 42_110) TaxID=1358809 RepID=S7XJS5_SPRLO|nr:Nop10 family protein [Spraguea lophii 42_110]
MLYHRIENNKRIYTLKETEYVSHPAKFSVTDKNSEYRIEIKKRNKIFPFE